MSLTSTHMMAIIHGCAKLKKLVINCDVWCDSTISDTVLTQLSKYCPQLNHLSLCPGNFQTTDLSLDALAMLPLEVLSFTSFPSLTENGIINLINRCKSLNQLYFEDCFQIKTSFISSLTLIFIGI